MSYEFSKTHPTFTLRDKQRHVRWMNMCLRKEKKRLGTIHYIYVTDKEILSINKEFLNHNYYTDIITFDYSANGVVSAEIYISADTVSSNARKYNQSVPAEMRRVMIHGLLHLCGYKDKTKSDQEVMKAKEDFYLLLWPKSKKD